MIEKSTAVMKRLGSEALENTEPNEIKHKDLASDYDEKDLSLRLRTLSDQSLTACRNLHLLVDQMNNRSKSKKTSGNAWRTLQSIVDRSLDMKNTNVQKFATLVLGITMSQMNSQLNTTNNSFGSVDTRTKMITSAIIPNSPFFDRNESGNCSKHERLIKFVARDSLLDLLRQSVDHNIDLQTVARIAFAFGVCSEQDHELGRAVANVVRYVFGNGCCCSDPNNDDDDDDELGSEGRIVNKDKASPTLALVAQCRPFSYIKTDELVRVAVADLDLWYSAELVCDASISSVTSNKKMETNLMVTSYPKFEPSELISTQSIDSSLCQGSIAHLTTKALIDTALDLRLYRRADLFATKFYAFGGAERFAEARFLHACDTITKVIKRKHPQVIEKQVLRVDECVSIVRNDLNLLIGQQKAGIGEVPIETMPHYIREFSLRRLRTSNMNAAAFRLANLWNMNYEQDPILIAEEEKKRQLTYVQWNDEGSPGNFSGNRQPLPDLISDAVVLAQQFVILMESPGGTIGFDAEWGDDNGVAVLQLSSVSHSVLLDIPALGSNEEGCKALQATVGKLFAGLTDTRYLVGFGCKEDVRRLRDSSYSSSVNWFPQKSVEQDLHSLITEASPTLGRKGGQHLGLSRSTESFLGKQLDKAEQCSDWSARPLSPEQREYACLDAWACAAIHTKIIGDRYRV
jgi:hypothetical protein